MLDTDDVVAGTSFSFGRVEEERIEWSSSPVSLQYASPFLVSLLMDAIEIHDVVNFSSLQRIDFQSSSPLSLCSCSFDLRMFAGRTTESLTKKNETVNHIYVCNGDEILVMSMLPLSVQVHTIYDYLQYFRCSQIY